MAPGAHPRGRSLRLRRRPPQDWPLRRQVSANLIKRLGVTAQGAAGSSCREWATEVDGQGFEIAEAILAHASGDATVRAYQRSDLLGRGAGDAAMGRLPDRPLLTGNVAEGGRVDARLPVLSGATLPISAGPGRGDRKLLERCSSHEY